MKKNVLIIGGGPAGMATMDKLFELGVSDLLLCERSDRLGGLLPQCIHDGFGLSILGKNLSGPEYSSLYIQKLKPHAEDILLEATVMNISKSEDEDYPVTAEIATSNGSIFVEAKTIVLATGCRERGRGAAYIPGTRPAGVYSAGLAQSLVNLKNLVIGNSAVIVGSGDIGLIMARRLTLEGVDVKCVVEIDKVPGGLPRNLRQCLYDYNIPLYLDTTVTNIYGNDRVTGVSLSNGMEIDCDTVILSVGLIPENSLLDYKSEIGKKVLLADGDEDFSKRIFLCGNSLFVHGLVDDVSNSGAEVAEEINEFLKGEIINSKYQYTNIEETRAQESERVKANKEKLVKKMESEDYYKTITCILCPNSCEIAEDGSGGKCERGAAYAAEERTAPKRVLTTSVMVWSDLISVRTSIPIPKEHIPEAMERIEHLRFGPDCAASFRGEPMPSRPMIHPGDVLVKDFIDGADLIATRGNIK